MYPDTHFAVHSTKNYRNFQFYAFRRVLNLLELRRARENSEKNSEIF